MCGCPEPTRRASSRRVGWFSEPKIGRPGLQDHSAIHDGLIQDLGPWDENIQVLIYLELIKSFGDNV